MRHIAFILLAGLAFALAGCAAPEKEESVAELVAALKSLRGEEGGE